MNQSCYPAIFHIAEDGGFWVTFPDFPECMTQGDNMQEAYDMAVETLDLTFSNYEKYHTILPNASTLDQIVAQANEYCVVVNTVKNQRKTLYKIEKVVDISRPI